MNNFVSVDIGESFANIFEHVPRSALAEFDKMLLNQTLDTALAQLHLVLGQNL